METLLQELRTKSLASYEKNMSERQVANKQRDERMKDAIEKIYEEIVSTSTEKMKTASENGNFGTVLFECTNDDKYDEEFKYVFLLKGPVRWNKEVPFFESKGTEPLLVKLKKYLNPIHVHMKYDRVQKMHKVIASWKTT
jgi:predicted AlkP superfamily pyrophosphatase or phosphodiesterase